MPTEYSDTGYRPAQSLDNATLGGLLGYFNTPAPRSSGEQTRPMSGVPTAQQEALQAPTVDPVLSLAMGPTFGLRAMLSSLAGGALASSLGAGRTGSMLNQIPVPNLLKVTAENPYLDAMTDRMYHIAKQQIMRTMGEGGMTQDMNPEEVSEMAKEIFWHDTPDFGSMVGYRGKPAQAAENMGEIIRRMVGEGSGARPLDYPLHDVGRRLGLAALLSGFRNMPWSSQNEVPYQE